MFHNTCPGTAHPSFTQTPNIFREHKSNCAPSLLVTNSGFSEPASRPPGSWACPKALRLPSEVCRTPPGHLCSCGTYISIDSV